MNIKILDSWLREYLETNAKPADIQSALSLSGPAVERLTKIGDDWLYEVEVTTNRIDAASVFGLGREAATILNHHGFKASLRPLNLTEPKVLKPTIEIQISDSGHLFRRILAVVIENIRVGDSPGIIKKRLEAAGVRSLNNIIDITNYVMLEIGHPAHVFDLDRLETRHLEVRLAKQGEKIITLDGKQYSLDNNDVVIDDGTGRIVDLPGIMGTANSVVTGETRRILFFIEVNDPVRIRKSSMKHAIRTLAASYNENGPDHEIAYQAFLRGVSLYQQLANGVVASKPIDINHHQDTLKEVQVTLTDFQSCMAVPITASQITTILADLGFECIDKVNQNFIFRVPSFRREDIDLKEDLIEEVARIYGYQKIPTRLPPFALITDPFIRKHSEDIQIEQSIKVFLSSSGFDELYNYSMISQADLLAFNLPANSIAMVNPMSQDLVYFRQSLVPSLAKNALANKIRGEIKIFEIANIYLPQKADLPQEKRTIGLICRGTYFELKGYLEALFRYVNLKGLRFDPGATLSYLDHQQSATITLHNQSLGYVGRLAPALGHRLGLIGDYTVAELNFAQFSAGFGFLKPIQSVPSTMPVIEDLTYQFTGKNYWESLVRSITKRFPEVQKIEFVSKFQDYVTMRIYSHLSKQHSLIEAISLFLEQDLHTLVKRLKDGNNK